jgi:hypothetical protein
MCVVLQVLGQVLGMVLQVLGLVLGLGLRRGLLRSSPFTHPQNFIFANLGQPRSLKIIYICRYRNHPGGQETLFTRDDIGKVQ